jgi:tetratricopeptide (TPR) repeat protein
MKRLLAVLVPAVTVLVGCAAPNYTAYEDGIRLYREGYYASARDAFDTAVRRDPKLAAAWNNRGVARTRLGDLEGAVQDYTQALSLAPADAEILFNRGNAHAAAGNLQAAIADFTTATTIRPGYAQAYYNRGAVRAVAGDHRGARADWQWAVDIEPDPWTKAAMRRGSGLVDDAYASPTSAAPAPRDGQGGVVVTTPPVTPGIPAQSAGTPPPSPTPGAPSGVSLDVRALVARAMGREVDGDRPGAVADLRAAVMAERDPARRARIDRLLRILEASR